MMMKYGIRESISSLSRTSVSAKVQSRTGKKKKKKKKKTSAQYDKMNRPHTPPHRLVSIYLSSDTESINF